MNSTNWWLKLIVFGLFMLLFGCSEDVEPAIEIRGSTMGTTYSVKVISTGFNQESLKKQIDDRLIDLNDVLSTYIPTSELSKLNRNERDEVIPISEDLRNVLEMSRKVYDLSGGAFDVTVGPLVNLWGFGPEGPTNGIPAAEQIETARSTTGFNRVLLSNEGIQRPAGLYIDLSAIAKGYAVDEIARLLTSAGANRYLVEIGGEVKTRGQNANNADWVIGLEAPDRSARRLLRTIPVRDLSMATSGDYRNYFEHEGRAYSHTIDPGTGWPVVHNQASATVLHESAAMADGLATACSVLGPAKTLALAEEMKLPVLAIIRDAEGFREELSSEMKRYLDKND
ncbi:MAG: FAD:protein FMN transferase [Gammaproteobacteria bacterium]|nr:FAD:protein FMN transferase [Gammaproteobacteria bacterium]